MRKWTNRRWGDLPVSVPRLKCGRASFRPACRTSGFKLAHTRFISTLQETSQILVATWGGSGSLSLSSNPQEAFLSPHPSFLSSFQLPERPLYRREDLPKGWGRPTQYLANQFCAAKHRSISSPEKTSQLHEGKSSLPPPWKGRVQRHKIQIPTDTHWSSKTSLPVASLSAGH